MKNKDQKWCPIDKDDNACFEEECAWWISKEEVNLIDEFCERGGMCSVKAKGLI